MFTNERIMTNSLVICTHRNNKSSSYVNRKMCLHKQERVINENVTLNECKQILHGRISDDFITIVKQHAGIRWLTHNNMYITLSKTVL